MLSIPILNQLHKEFVQANQMDYNGELIGADTVCKSIKRVEDEVYLNDCILVFNKSTWEITVWYISLHKDTFKAEIEFLYNLQECMGIDYENRKPILEWIYQSLSFDNIKDCIKRLS